MLRKSCVKGINEVEVYHYHELGNEQGEPILLHHGYTSSALVWSQVVSHIPLERFRCVLFDTRGSGANASAYQSYVDFTLKRLAEDVIGLADALGIGQFSFVGHSMGGGIGMLLALDHPHRLKRLILVASIPSFGLRHIPPKAHERDRLTRSRPDARERLETEARVFHARPVADEEIRRSIDSTLSITRGHFEGAWEAMVSFDVSEILHTIRVPTLVIAGAADGLLPWNLRDFEKLKNASLHVFNRVGHGIPHEVPKELAECVVDFILHGVVNSSTLIQRFLAERRKEKLNDETTAQSKL